MKNSKAYIILPAYNEEGSIQNLLEGIDNSMKDYNYRVILVDDGSTDGTKEIAGRFQDRMSIDILSHQENRGLGEAIKTGFKWVINRLSVEDLVVTMDADNTHPPALIPVMIEEISKGGDVIIASRYRTGGGGIGLPYMRRLFSRGACLLFKIVFPLKGVSDYTSGYRIYSGKILHMAFRRYGEGFVSEKGFTCMSEILLKLARTGARFGEIPLVLRYDLKIGKSKINIVRTILRYLYMMTYYRFNIWFKRA